ncbi:CocE/NonD family hydrolase, partial [Thermodesulfobacteriota bacterium]
SYVGLAQEALAMEQPPHLKAMFIGGGSTNYHMDTEGTGGAFRAAHNLMYSFYLATDMEDGAIPAAARRAWLAECEKNAGAWLKLPLSRQIAIFEHMPSAQKWYSDWITHQNFDDYWKQKGCCAEGRYDEYPDIPIYRFGGHYAQYSVSSMKSHIELTKLNRSPNFLQYGPWVHAECGDVEFGIEHPSNDKRERMRDEQLRFFDQFFKGLNTGLLDEPKVKIFVMGGGEGVKSNQGRLVHGGGWRFEDAWPLPQITYTNYYLKSDGTLEISTPGKDDPSSGYTYDPNDPVPTLGGPYTYPRENSGPRDQMCRTGLYGCKNNLPVSSRMDVLSFMTPPLAEDVDIIGPVIVKLWASSSAVDTDFTAKLIDQYPPGADYPHGYALGVIDGIIRARYRESLENPVLMDPGKVYEFTIDLWQVSNRFKAGHRIRLDISSSNFPALDANPNTGEDIGFHTRSITAHNAIYHDAERPSHIILPIIPVKK